MAYSRRDVEETNHPVGGEPDQSLQEVTPWLALVFLMEGREVVKSYV